MSTGHQGASSANLPIEEIEKKRTNTSYTNLVTRIVTLEKSLGPASPIDSSKKGELVIPMTEYRQKLIYKIASSIDNDPLTRKGFEEILMKVVRVEDLVEIILSIMNQAKKGNIRAAEFVLDRTIGKPKEESEDSVDANRAFILNQINVSAPVPDKPNNLEIIQTGAQTEEVLEPTSTKEETDGETETN